MSFAEQYKEHAYADLIQESEKQGIGIGVKRERERIIKLLEDEKWHHMVIHMTNPPKRAHDYNCIGCRQIALIKGENK